MNRRRPTMVRGFTLLEVLLVLAILVVLAAVLTTNLFSTQEDAMVKATTASIKSFEGKVQEYAINNNGRFPEGDLEDVVEVMMNPPEKNGVKRKPYIEETPKDAWGEPLIYEYGEDRQTPGGKPIISSKGIDNRAGTDDDILNYNPENT